MTKNNKQTKRETNTGSQLYQLQRALDKINNLNIHIGRNSKDFASKRRLIHNVNAKNRILKYLEKSKQMDLYNKAILLCGKKKKEISQ